MYNVPKLRKSQILKVSHHFGTLCIKGFKHQILKVCLTILKVSRHFGTLCINEFKHQILKVSHHFESAPSFWYIMHQSVQTLTHYRPSLLKMSLFHRCFSNILPVKTNYLVSTLVEHWLKMG